MKDPAIQELQDQRNVLMAAARNTSDSQERWTFRQTRNVLKKKIKMAKKSFIQDALSSKKPKAVWKVIHRVLHPNPQRIKFDPNKLNKHFSVTVECTAGIVYDETNAPAT